MNLFMINSMMNSWMTFILRWLSFHWGLRVVKRNKKMIELSQEVFDVYDKIRKSIPSDVNLSIAMEALAGCISDAMCFLNIDKGVPLEIIEEDIFSGIRKMNALKTTDAKGAVH